VNHFGLLIGAAVALAACSKNAPETTPEQAAEKYFGALASGDCPGIQAWSGGELAAKIAKEGCPAAFEEAKSHGLVFVGASGARPDGRDPNARLVDIAIKTDGKDKRVIGRIERVGDAWKVVTL